MNTEAKIGRIYLVLLNPNLIFLSVYLNRFLARTLKQIYGIFQASNTGINTNTQQSLMSHLSDETYEHWPQVFNVLHATEASLLVPGEYQRPLSLTDESNPFFASAFVEEPSKVIAARLESLASPWDQYCNGVVRGPYES